MGSSAELLGEVGGSVGSTEAIEKDADAAWPAPTLPGDAAGTEEEQLHRLFEHRAKYHRFIVLFVWHVNLG